MVYNAFKMFLILLAHEYFANLVDWLIFEYFDS